MRESPFSYDLGIIWMKREDFVFTIGYDGDTAIVDGKARKRYGKLDTAGLVEAGLYKAAFCSALFSGSEEEAVMVLKAYNSGEGTSYESPENLKRLFGVFQVRTDIQKVKSL
jgi:hypothetical protein